LFDEWTRDATRLQWPSPRYLDDLEGFARDILGIRFWSKQREIGCALVEHRSVAVKAGQKVSKTFTLAIRALHFYCCYADSQTYLTAPTLGQVDKPMWRTISELVSRSGICADCRDRGVRTPCEHSCKIDGTLLATPKGGLKSKDGLRSVMGLAVRHPDNVSGKSGPNMLWILDEVIGIPNNIIEAILGTQMGGAWMAIASNPTTSDPTNFFWKAFNDKNQRGLYSLHTISSLDSPNVTGECKVPGLAEPNAIEQARVRWGEDSREWRNRILGEFTTQSEGQMLSVEQWQSAITRNDVNLERPQAWEADVLHIGVDVAGEGTDLWTAYIRRGCQSIACEHEQFIDAAAGVAWLEAIILQYRRDREPVQVKYDGEGQYGAEFGKELAPLRRKYPELVIRPVISHADDPTGRFARLRDAMVEHAVTRIKRDFGVLLIRELEEEALALERDLDYRDASNHGRTKVKEKKHLKKKIGRSPDRLDAMIYSLWEGAIGVVVDATPAKPAVVVPIRPRGVLSGVNPHSFKLAA